jgi:hypothetical protein
MEIAKVEVAALEVTQELAKEHGVVELHELQLALVGGGIGEVIVA